MDPLLLIINRSLMGCNGRSIIDLANLGMNLGSWASALPLSHSADLHQAVFLRLTYALLAPKGQDQSTGLAAKLAWPLAAPQLVLQSLDLDRQPMTGSRPQRTKKAAMALCNSVPKLSGDLSRVYPRFDLIFPREVLDPNFSKQGAGFLWIHSA